MTRFKIHITTCILSIAACSQALPQSPITSLPELGLNQVIPKNYQHIGTIHPEELGENELNIYETSQESSMYMYIPYVSFDWNALANQISIQCRTQDAETLNNAEIRDLGQQSPQKKEKVSITLPLQFYWKALTDEIRSDIARLKSISISTVSVGLPPNAGIQIYLHDSEDNPFEILSTIPATSLLRNVPLTVLSGGSPAQRDGTLTATCPDLINISQRRKMTALMFAVGSQINMSRISAAAQTVLDAKFISNLKNDESQIKKSTVASTGGGGGFTLKIGPIGVGKQRQSTATTVSEENLRIVNRNWLDDAVRKRSSDIDISSTCDQPCDLQTLMKETTDLLLSDLQAQQIEIDSTAEDTWRAKSAAVDMSINKISVDDELKSVLNSAEKHIDSQEGEAKGYKFKKNNDDSITVNSDLSFKRKGDQWVPRTLNAYVVNTLDLERAIHLRRSHTVIEASKSIAIQLPVITSRQPTNALSSKNYFRSMKELAEKIRTHMAPQDVIAKMQLHIFSENDRHLGVWYTNDRPHTIVVRVGTGPEAQMGRPAEFCEMSVEIDHLRVFKIEQYTFVGCQYDFKVPPGSTYRVAGERLQYWNENR